MLKYLIIALILLLLFYAPVRKALRGKPQGEQARKPQPAKAQEMVPCAHCGVHLPDGEAVRDDQGRSYCSAAHRMAGPAPT